MTSYSYELEMRQQPKHSRMCGVGSKADRRPIDPPPIVQLKVYSNANNLSSRSDLSFNHFQSPYFFVYCSLATEHTDQELHLLSETKTRYTTGNVTSSVYCLRDLDLSEVLVAVFPDVSVRVEGRFRLKFSLFEISNSKTYHRKSLFSNPFTVFSAKRFPGMDQSTELSQCLANQGLKIRIRRDNRRDRRKSSKRYFEPDEDELVDGGVRGNTSMSAGSLGPVPIDQPALSHPSLTSPVSANATTLPLQQPAPTHHPQPAYMSYNAYNFKRPLAPLPSRMANIPGSAVPFTESGEYNASGAVHRPQGTQQTHLSPFAAHTHAPLTRPLSTLPTLPFERSLSGGVRSATGASSGTVPTGTPTPPGGHSERLSTIMGLGHGHSNQQSAQGQPQHTRMHSTPILYRPSLGTEHTRPTFTTQPTSSVSGVLRQETTAQDTQIPTPSHTQAHTRTSTPTPTPSQPPSLPTSTSMPSFNLPRIQLPPIRDLIQAPGGGAGAQTAARTQQPQPQAQPQPQTQGHSQPSHSPHSPPPFNPSNFKPPNQR